ncbi:chemotaxis protein CheD [Candidatus Magnetomoraceae bacterium gMMP-15]
MRGIDKTMMLKAWGPKRAVPNSRILYKDNLAISNARLRHNALYPIEAHYPVDLPVIYLKPGEMCITKEPTIVTTVLGSCISVTMFSNRLKISAICHALLPQCREITDCQMKCINKFKYVDCVVPIMAEKLINYGIKPADLEVKLFGGARMFGSENKASSLKSVGQSNIDAVKKILKAQRIILKKRDVGGLFGRKLYFYTHTGEVFLKSLKSSRNRK